jgi:hypothetical protein
MPKHFISLPSWPTVCRERENTPYSIGSSSNQDLGRQHTRLENSSFLIHDLKSTIEISIQEFIAHILDLEPKQWLERVERYKHITELIHFKETLLVYCNSKSEYARYVPFQHIVEYVWLKLKEGRQPRVDTKVASTYNRSIEGSEAIRLPDFSVTLRNLLDKDTIHWGEMIAFFELKHDSKKPPSVQRETPFAIDDKEFLRTLHPAKISQALICSDIRNERSTARGSFISLFTHRSIDWLTENIGSYRMNCKWDCLFTLLLITLDVILRSRP